MFAEFRCSFCMCFAVSDLSTVVYFSGNFNDRQFTFGVCKYYKQNIMVIRKMCSFRWYDSYLLLKSQNMCFVAIKMTKKCLIYYILAVYWFIRFCGTQWANFLQTKTEVISKMPAICLHRYQPSIHDSYLLINKSTWHGPWHSNP